MTDADILKRFRETYSQGSPIVSGVELLGSTPYFKREYILSLANHIENRLRLDAMSKVLGDEICRLNPLEKFAMDILLWSIAKDLKDEEDEKASAKPRAAKPKSRSEGAGSAVAGAPRKTRKAARIGGKVVDGKRALIPYDEPYAED
jgi:hypothetical protein